MSGENQVILLLFTSDRGGGILIHTVGGEKKGYTTICEPVARHAPTATTTFLAIPP